MLVSGLAECTSWRLIYTWNFRVGECRCFFIFNCSILISKRCASILAWSLQSCLGLHLIQIITWSVNMVQVCIWNSGLPFVSPMWLFGVTVSVLFLNTRTAIEWMCAYCCGNRLKNKSDSSDNVYIIEQHAMQIYWYVQLSQQVIQYSFPSSPDPADTQQAYTWGLISAAITWWVIACM